MNGMERKVSELAPLDRVQVSGQQIENTAPAANEHAAACACPRCGTYKWYPPLLVLSTVLTGVFCWLYISKPVFMTQSAEPREEEEVAEVGGKAESVVSSAVAPAARPNSRSSQEAGTYQQVLDPYAGLDPSMNGLPGEKPEAASPVHASIEDLLKKDLSAPVPIEEEPVVTEHGTIQIKGLPVEARKREGSSLFTPFTAGDGKKEIDGSENPKGPVKESDPLHLIPGFFDGQAPPVRIDRGDEKLKPVRVRVLRQAPDPPARSRSDEDDFQVSPSFMADMTTASNPKKND